MLTCLGLAAGQSISADEMHGQTAPYVPPSLVTLRSKVNEVEVPVVVRDGNRTVAGLTKENFEVYDAGTKQKITAFSEQRFTFKVEPGGSTKSAAGAPAEAAGPSGETRPRFIVLCFDDLNIEPAPLKMAKDAALRFLQTSLAPGDRAAVVTTSRSHEVEFTGDASKLAEQIAQVNANRGFADDSSLRCLLIRPYEAYLLANRLDQQVLEAKVDEYVTCPGGADAASPEEAVIAIAKGVWERVLYYSRVTLRSIENLVGSMSKLPGERMILLTSAGFLTGNLEFDEDRLMTRAVHAGIVINTLDAKQLHTVTTAADATEASPIEYPLPPRVRIIRAQTAARQVQAKDDGLVVLAAGTGGTFYHNSNDMVRGFRALGMVPDSMYVLGFAPSNVVADGRYHPLRVRLTGAKRYSLQARLGYTAPSSAATRTSSRSNLDEAAIASETITDLPAGFTWVQRAGPPSITMVARLDVSRWHFETKKDQRQQKVTFVGLLLDSDGTFVTGKRSELELNFSQATFEHLEKSGLVISMTLQAPPGNYSARTLVRDGLEGKLAAAGSAVQIR